MHLYWRMMEELRYLGEIMIFHDPGLKREYRTWTGKKSEVLSLISGKEIRRSPRPPRSFIRLTSMN